MAEPKYALEIRLKKFNPRAPAFHKHIAKARLQNTICKVGDKVAVYTIVATVPESPVVVTEDTLFLYE